MKTLVWVGCFIGSGLGFLPVLWGGSLFSMSSIILSAIGGFLGIWAGWKFADWLTG